MRTNLGRECLRMFAWDAPVYHPPLLPPHRAYTNTHQCTNTKMQTQNRNTTDKKKEFMGNGVLLPPLNPAIMPRGASGFSAIR